MTAQFDTIFALSTAPGKAGVAVVRVSGADAWNSFNLLIPNQKNPVPRQAVLRTLANPVSRETIDSAMVIGFRGPASFTGEDVVEYHLHGSPAAVDSLLTALSGMDRHRVAAPGEFTRRAFENGKMDLTAAEAVADLIAAETAEQKNQALAQMGGSLSRLYDGWRETLIRALAQAEAAIDFAEDDLPGDPLADLRPGVQALIADISAHLDDNRRGERLRDGVRVAILGAPNAGKSSLLNALARRDAAIVSPLAGTTRDVIELSLNLSGYPVVLSDTAGLRPSRPGETGHDAIESEGVRRAVAEAGRADIKLLLFDSTTRAPDPQTLALIDENSLIVLTKTDLGPLPLSLQGEGLGDGLRVSIQTGEGMDTFISTLTSRVAGMIGTRESPALTRTRHRAALEETAARLQSALSAPAPELVAEDLRLASRALGRITGRVDVEDVLDVIFRDFCIGK